MRPAFVSADPFCGPPQHPFRVRVRTGFAATGGPPRKSVMSRKTRQARTGQDRASPYDEITDNIIAELEAGRAPGSNLGGRRLRRRRLPTPPPRRNYSGINVLILWSAAVNKAFRARAGSPPPGAPARRQCPQRRARHDRRPIRNRRARAGASGGRLLRNLAMLGSFPPTDSRLP